MPRKTKKAPNTKSNGIRWTAARRKAHGKKIQAARKAAEVNGAVETASEILGVTPRITEAIRTKVRAILPEIIDEEIAALLER